MARLIGAFHAYLWGDGRSKESVERMRALGLDRMWLGYDADARPCRVSGRSLRLVVQRPGSGNG
ncbi:hypothetical protein FBY35_0806 [Streptomyces sp. SLBN-118]|uniref:hypothetical protein n=1 Tax=Streptomyces sp. SLBN-118 TaxID=2768454 RepID=UPI001171CC06|nr:hypothetical protein [Streptomyces sp. SLBN-118]TQK50473.1 hypothetical protein FBY35_0806 [Streptomyces sp. SLBN-118]